MNAFHKQALQSGQDHDGAQQKLAFAAEKAAAELNRLMQLFGGAPREIAQEAARGLATVMPGRRYHDIPQSVLELGTTVPGFAAFLVATLITRLPARAASLNVPARILPELGDCALRILANPPTDLNDDVARKDIGICLALVLPCVGQVLESTGTIPRGAALRGGPGSGRLLAQLARTKFRNGPYVEMHTHTPMLGGFNEAGFESCYRMGADLHRVHPELLGMTGGSWLDDPALATISPRLAYITQTPVAHGAFLVRLGVTPEDMVLATAKSPTRRKLAEAGKYIPTKWQIIWPREALLAWADAQAAKNG